MAAGPVPVLPRQRAASSTPTSRACDDPWVDERTSRVWIQGDLHAENYGTYMDSAGMLVFDVNDFDEAYVGHYTWDLQRMAASLALLGFAKALSDEAITQIDRDLRAAPTSTRSGVRQRRTATTSSASRSTTPTARCTRQLLTRPGMSTRIQLLDRNTTSRATSGGSPTAARRPPPGRRRARRGARGLRELPRDDPRASSASTASRTQVKDVVGRKGFGIGSAGLPAFNLLIEGRSARRWRTT